MTWLIVGLVVFLGIHMTRVVAEDWRMRMIQRVGAQTWKRTYSAISFVSLAAIIYGFAVARADSAVLWVAPKALVPVTAALMLASMILLAGFHVKRSHVSTISHHPMLWSVVVLSAAHLLVNGRVVDALLFGAFLVWSVVDLISCYGRDARYGVAYPQPEARATLINLAMGVAFFAVFAGFLHKLLIGVSPIPAF